MKTYSFPYGGSFGRGDSWEGENDFELTDEEAERLEASAREKPRYELDEDPEISDIYDKVYAFLYNHDLEELLNDEDRIEELREEYEDEDDDEEMTDRQLAEAYLEESSFVVYYPEELQELRVCALCGEEIASIAVCALSGPIGWGAAAVVAGTGAAAAAVGGGITAAVTAKD